MRRRDASMRAAALAVALTGGACGKGNDSGATSSDADVGRDSDVGEGATRTDAAAGGFFDKCGGKIVDGNGAVSSDEYKRQARLWDRATIDCRLGPNFDFYHSQSPGTAAPTAPELPSIPNSGGVLCPSFDHDTPGPATYGSTSGQVAYAPDDGSDPGLDRLQTVGWEGRGQCYQPHQGPQLNGSHPDPAITEWKSQGAAPGVPIAKGRTEHGETGDGVIVFSNGLVGTTGTQTSGSTHPRFDLPANKVPTAVAVTNYGEFALVTIWDTDAVAGQVAVFALHAPKPEAFSVALFGAPNEGGFDALALLGYIDLPDMKTPTAISAAGNNTGHNGPWIQQGAHAYQGIGSIFADLSYASMVANDAAGVWTSDPMAGPGLFGNAGGAMVASRWEGKVTFLDLAPLYRFVRKVYVDPIANKNDEALYTKATTTSKWPFDFASNPEMKPLVVTTVAVPDPTVVRMGLAPRANTTGLPSKLLSWVGNLEGHVLAFDASALTGRSGTSGTPITKVAEVAVDPNLTSMHLTDENDALFVSSRGNRSVQWLTAGASSVDVVQQFRDSRLLDPVATDNNQRVGTLITVGDFNAGKVMNFEWQKGACAADGGAVDAGTCTTYAFDGELSFPGAVYLVDTANVN